MIIKLLNECDNLAALIIVRDNLIVAIIFGDSYDSLSTCSSRKYARYKCFYLLCQIFRVFFLFFACLLFVLYSKCKCFVGQFFCGKLSSLSVVLYDN